MITSALLHLLGRQHGVASDVQLLEHLTRRQIRRAQSVGVLSTELPGVRRLAGARPDVASRVMALSLFAGSDGFVSGMTAARQLDVTCVPPQYFEVTTVERKTPSLPTWVTCTRSRWRVDNDRVELSDGRIVSSPLRTLFRCGATCSDVRFEKIAEQLWHLRLITPAEASEYLQVIRRQGRTGVARFERWLERAIERPRPSQSSLEVDLASAVVALGLPEPLRQFPLALPMDETIHLDLAWPNALLGLEPGSTFWHGGDAKTRADHSRDRACDEVGWRILRFDEVELRNLDACARQVRRIYRERLRHRATGHQNLWSETTAARAFSFSEDLP